jgi:hypothetical protein
MSAGREEARIGGAGSGSSAPLNLTRPTALLFYSPGIDGNDSARNLPPLGTPPKFIVYGHTILDIYLGYSLPSTVYGSGTIRYGSIYSSAKMWERIILQYLCAVYAVTSHRR